jgi:hypothetical protein
MRFYGGNGRLLLESRLLMFGRLFSLLLFGLAACAFGYTDKTNIVVVDVVFTLIFLCVISKYTITSRGFSVFESGDIGGRRADLDRGSEVLAGRVFSAGGSRNVE